MRNRWGHRARGSALGWVGRFGGLKVLLDVLGKDWFDVRKGRRPSLSQREANIICSHVCGWMTGPRSLRPCSRGSPRLDGAISRARGLRWGLEGTRNGRSPPATKHERCDKESRTAQHPKKLRQPTVARAHEMPHWQLERARAPFAARIELAPACLRPKSEAGLLALV
jgi:hypothetical protein